MTARVLDGTAIAQTIRTEVAAQVARLSAQGQKPGLAAVLVGEDPASAVYVRSKGKACEEAGMHSVTLRLPANTTEAELLETVDWTYPEKRVRLSFFRCTIAGEPRGLEGQEIVWVRPAELARYHFPPADATLLERLRAGAGT